MLLATSTGRCLLLLHLASLLHQCTTAPTPVRPPGVSNEVWQFSLDFEKECKECQSCQERDGGFQKMLGRPYQPRNQHDESVPEYWLHIVVGTVPRRASKLVTNYLTQLLDSVEHQLELPSVHLTMFNHRPQEHPEFLTLQKKYKESNKISMIDLEANTCDPPRPAGWSFHGGLSPFLRARQQTRDVTNMLLQVQDSSHYVLLVEDDFIFCPQALSLMYYKLMFVQAQVQFSALRFGVGMSGILLRSADIPPFAQYLYETQHNMPVDLLATEWFLAAMPIPKWHYHKEHPFIINKETLVSHIGDVSSFSDKRGIRKTATCGERVRVRSFFEQKESYQPACDNVEVSPCNLFRQGRMLRVRSRGSIRPDLIPRTVRVVVAKPGQNCNEGCVSEGRGFDQCHSIEKSKLTSCGLVKRYLPACVACVVSKESGAAVIGSASGTNDKRGDVCVVPSEAISVSTASCTSRSKKKTSRQICVCSSKTAMLENSKIIAEQPQKNRRL